MTLNNKNKVHPDKKLTEPLLKTNKTFLKIITNMILNLLDK